MRRKLILNIETHDNANIRHLHDAIGLVGGRTAGETHEARSMRRSELEEAPRAVQEARLFGRLNGPEINYDDVVEAVKVIKLRAQDFLAKLDTDEVFLDPKIQKTYADGVRANVEKAILLSQQFLDDLHEDMRASAN